MDFEILPQLIIVLSAVGILFVLGKNFSKMKAASEEEELFIDNTIQEEIAKEKFLYLYKRALRRINKEDYQKKMADFWIWFEKFLRKLRIMFLKLDARIVAILERLRKRNIDHLDNIRKKTESNIRKNMDNENLSKFWNAKKANFMFRDHKKMPLSGEEPLSGDTMVLTETKVTTMSADSVAHVEKNAEIEIVKEEIESPAVQKAEARLEAVEVVAEIVAAAQAEVAEEEAKQTKFVATADEDETEAEKDEPEPLKEESVEDQKIRTQKEKEYIETLMKNPVDIKAYWKLGIIYSKRRNYDDALACFRQIVKIDPSYTKAKQKAIELMENMKKKGK